MEMSISADQWVVYPHYEVVNGRIVGFGSLTKARAYYPFEHPELPNALAKVKSHDQVMDFVHRYGTLGGSPNDDGGYNPGDSIEWIERQGKTTDLVLRMAKCSAADDEDEANSICGSLGSFSLDVIDVPSGLTLDTSLGRVRFMAAAIINANIQGIARKANMLSDGSGIKSSFHFSTLLNVVYWQILNVIEGDAVIANCEQCHAPFIKTDGRQRFCPKRYGEAESRCAILFRQRKLREKQ